MKPVEQTILKPPTGNCHAACLASILELPLERVPSIYEGADKPGYDRDKAWARQHNWLWAMGLAMHWNGPAEGETWGTDKDNWPMPAGWWIATHEINGLGHSTVWKGTRLRWNPMPGVEQTEEALLGGELVMTEWFECLDPALLARNLPGRWKRAERKVQVTVHRRPPEPEVRVVPVYIDRA